MNAQEIGETRREFKPGLENLVAGIIIGLLLIGAGCAGLFVSAKAVIESRQSMPFIAEKGDCWAAVGVFSALGIGAIVVGVFLIRWIRSLSSLRVAVGVDGLSVTPGETRRTSSHGRTSSRSGKPACISARRS